MDRYTAFHKHIEIVVTTQRKLLHGVGGQHKR